MTHSHCGLSHIILTLQIVTQGTIFGGLAAALCSEARTGLYMFTCMYPIYILVYVCIIYMYMYVIFTCVCVQCTHIGTHRSVHIHVYVSNIHSRICM